MRGVTYRFPLGDGDARHIDVHLPVDITIQDLDLLDDYLALVRRAIFGQPAAPPSPRVPVGDKPTVIASGVDWEIE